MRRSGRLSAPLAGDCPDPEPDPEPFPMSDTRLNHPTCAECAYFQSNGATSGTCHRYPPSFAGEHPAEHHTWRFPAVTSFSWCGEFAPDGAAGSR